MQGLHTRAVGVQSESVNAEPAHARHVVISAIGALVGLIASLVFLAMLGNAFNSDQSGLAALAAALVLLPSVMTFVYAWTPGLRSKIFRGNPPRFVINRGVRRAVLVPLITGLIGTAILIALLATRFAGPFDYVAVAVYFIFMMTLAWVGIRHRYAHPEGRGQGH
jgi:O-antigen/teichoic acid export membrane protein